MDPDVFPNSIEYWGPNGMVFFRNVQFRWMPLQKATSNFTSRSSGRAPAPTRASTRTASSSRTSRAASRCPDLSAHYRMAGDWGHVQVAGIAARDRVGRPATRPVRAQRAARPGWGFNVSSNIKLGEDTCPRLQVVYGEGIENYMNDAPVDIGIENNLGNPRDAGRRQGAAGARASSRSSTSTGTRSGRAPSATRA